MSCWRGTPVRGDPRPARAGAGDAHPDTLLSRNNLATAYQDAGDLERAIPLYEAALARREQVLGDAHPRTLNSRNNLAGARRTAQAVQRRSTATAANGPDQHPPQEPNRGLNDPHRHIHIELRIRRLWIGRPGPSPGRPRPLNAGRQRPTMTTQAATSRPRSCKNAGPQDPRQDPGQEDSSRPAQLPCYPNSTTSSGRYIAW
jgi:hypothetical protein